MRRLRSVLSLLVISLLLSCATALAADHLNPLSYQGVRDAMKSGMDKSELVEMIKRHGVEFELTPAKESELKTEGASAEVLSAINHGYRRTPQTARPTILSIRDVRKMYIEKMSRDLDQYLKSEIARQMPNTLVVVLDRGDADAVMSGSATETNGTVTVTDIHGKLQLWTSAAGDRNPVLIIHEGPKKIAQRIVSHLKDSMN
jgi:hypothetical protein